MDKLLSVQFSLCLHKAALIEVLNLEITALLFILHSFISFIYLFMETMNIYEHHCITQQHKRIRISSMAAFYLLSRQGKKSKYTKQI